MTDVTYCRPAEVAQALGVSTSTVKRWVDEGVLAAHKTAGGHRRILRAAVLRLVREGNFLSLDLERLGLPGSINAGDRENLARQLLTALREGDITLMRSVIHGSFAAGVPIETLGDEVIAPAMVQLGQDWEAGRIDVLHEHRGTLLCVGLLHELRPALEANIEKDRPVAVGGNPTGDYSLLASLLIQMVLMDAGWNAMNLGPNTPLRSFRVALEELKPRLVWLSASHITDPESFLQEYATFHTQAQQTGSAVAVGGQALAGELGTSLPATFHGTCLTDLAAFAGTLHQRPRPPKRGRPARPGP